MDSGSSTASSPFLPTSRALPSRSAFGAERAPARLPWQAARSAPGWQLPCDSPVQQAGHILNAIRNKRNKKIFPRTPKSGFHRVWLGSENPLRHQTKSENQTPKATPNVRAWPRDLGSTSGHAGGRPSARKPRLTGLARGRSGQAPPPRQTIKRVWHLPRPPLRPPTRALPSFPSWPPTRSVFVPLPLEVKDKTHPEWEPGGFFNGIEQQPQPQQQ